MDRILYQTVEDRDNPDEVEQNGPFMCTNSNAWLGHGFYFWDSFISHAHWWGRLVYAVDRYMICQTSCDGDLKEVYDLVGKPELFAEIEQSANIIKARTNAKTIFVAEVLEFLKKHTSFLKYYKAIRVYPIETMPNADFRIKFNYKNHAYLDTRPAIQFCIWDKSILNSKYHIVYPDTYCEDSVM